MRVPFLRYINAFSYFPLIVNLAWLPCLLDEGVQQIQHFRASLIQKVRDTIGPWRWTIPSLPNNSPHFFKRRGCQAKHTDRERHHWNVSSHLKWNVTKVVTVRISEVFLQFAPIHFKLSWFRRVEQRFPKPVRITEKPSMSFPPLIVFPSNTLGTTKVSHTFLQLFPQHRETNLLLLLGALPPTTERLLLAF